MCGPASYNYTAIRFILTRKASGATYAIRKLSFPSTALGLAAKLCENDAEKFSNPIC